MDKSNQALSANKIGDFWSSSVSDYISLRRQQNYSIYHKDNRCLQATIDGLAKTAGQQAVNIAVDSTLNSLQHILFKAMFIVLAKQLEEGHTVLTLTMSDDEIAIQGIVNAEECNANQQAQPVPLYIWQIQFLDVLAASLYWVINKLGRKPETEIGTGTEEAGLHNSIFHLLDSINTMGEKLWLQLNLTRRDKDLLLERVLLLKKIYQLFMQINAEAEKLKLSSLQKFVELVAETDLFSDKTESHENSLSKINYPIIYQTTLEKNDKKLSITFWLYRTWQAEYTLAKQIKNLLSQQVKPLPIKLTDKLNTQQIAAINTANTQSFCIITGGPGTGKTYTVAQLVIALQQAKELQGNSIKNVSFGNSASLALAAPTGKAAQRMQESLQAALYDANEDMQLEDAKTIHRLLGIGQNGQPRYHASNPLSEDIIIVDEASMLGVELANALVNAVKPGARLILLGDANQLAAVEAGAVLADLCHIASLQTVHVTLTESRRFKEDSAIGKLASLINMPSSKAANPAMAEIWRLLSQSENLSFDVVPSLIKNDIKSDDDYQKNSLSKKSILYKLSNYYLKYIKKITPLYNQQFINSSPNRILIDSIDIQDIFNTFNEFRILTAGHNGQWGDDAINDYLTQWHINTLKLPLGKSAWFHGRPIMILQNNYELGLFNGDIGICLQVGRELKVFFENKTQGIAANLLNDELITTAYAMTIHKSQGSEFNHVAITFDDTNARLLSKELIYTAVTRAKNHVSIFSTKSAFEMAVNTATQRQTGLELQFT